MATEVPQGAPAPAVLTQTFDEVLPDGVVRPYIGAAKEVDPFVDELAPADTPVVGPTDSGGEAFNTTEIPCGANEPLTADQADYLNEKYDLEPPTPPVPVTGAVDSFYADATGTVHVDATLAAALVAGTSSLTLDATAGDTAAQAVIDGQTYAVSSVDPESGIVTLTGLDLTGQTVDGLTATGTVS